MMNRGFPSTLRNTVTNSSSRTAADVHVKTILPGSFNLNSVSEPSYEQIGDEVDVNLGAVSSGSRQIDISVTPTQVGTFLVESEITTTSPDNNLEDNQDEIEIQVQDLCSVVDITDGGGTTFECYPEGQYVDTMPLTSSGFDLIVEGANPFLNTYIEDFEWQSDSFAEGASPNEGFSQLYGG